jgi:hypothetical protein
MAGAPPGAPCGCVCGSRALPAPVYTIRSPLRTGQVAGRRPVPHLSGRGGAGRCRWAALGPWREERWPPTREIGRRARGAAPPPRPAPPSASLSGPPACVRHTPVPPLATRLPAAHHPSRAPRFLCLPLFAWAGAGMAAWPLTRPGRGKERRSIFLLSARPFPLFPTPRSHSPLFSFFRPHSPLPSPLQAHQAAAAKPTAMTAAADVVGSLSSLQLVS